VRTQRLVLVFALGLGLTLALMAFLQPGHAAPSSPSILYVAPDGSDASLCDSPTNRCKTIQRAVNVAAAGDEIRVAAGTYTGTQTITASNGYTYTQVVFLDKSLVLRGGYSPGDWNTSNPTANPTVLDAQRRGRGLSIIGTGVQTVTVDGFTLTGGDYTGLRNALEGNDLGGGLYAYDSALTLANCVVTDNLASRTVWGKGGGIALNYVRSDPGVRIENTHIISNYAYGDTSIYGGGGLYAENVSRPMTITRSVVRDNTSGTSGGGISLSYMRSVVVISMTDLISNTAQDWHGGGLFANLTAGAELRLERVRLLDNRANQGAAAVYVYPSGTSGAPGQVRLTNVLLAGNVITRAGADDYDAVIGLDTPYNNMGLDVSLTHVTAADNQAPTFLYAYQSRANSGMTVTLTNTLIVSATNAFAAEEIGSVVIQHTNTLTDHVTTLHKTLGGSPVFTAVNPLTGDPKLDANYRLQAGSAAIDAGVDTGVTTDLDGDRRPIGRAPDIGADEAWSRIYLPVVMRN
jgi:hypothetical protein